MQILGIFLIGSYICRREKSHILRFSGNKMKNFCGAGSAGTDCAWRRKKPPPYERKRLSHNADIGNFARVVRKVRYDQRREVTAGHDRRRCTDGENSAAHSKPAESRRGSSHRLIFLGNPPQGREALVLQVFVCFCDPVAALGADNVLKCHMP